MIVHIHRTNILHARTVRPHAMHKILLHRAAFLTLGVSAAGMFMVIGSIELVEFERYKKE